MTDDDKKRTSAAVWDRLNQQGDSISELARAQAATEANLAALAQSVQSGFDSINSSITRIVDRDSRPTNWIGVGSLLFVVIGALITFVALQTDPVRSKADQNAEHIDDIFARELADAEKRGEFEARIKALEEELRLVDQYGSRRWINGKDAED